MAGEVRRLAADGGSSDPGWMGEIRSAVKTCGDDDLGTIVVARAVLARSAVELRAERERQRAADRPRQEQERKRRDEAERQRRESERQTRLGTRRRLDVRLAFDGVVAGCRVGRSTISCVADS